VTIEEYRSSVSQSKRNAIVQAAIETFLDSGFGNAGMAKIAEVAKVSTATLYKHFDSKEQLFVAITDTLIHDQPLPSPKSGLNDLSFADGLNQLGDQIVHLMSLDRVIPLFRLVIAEAYKFPELRNRVYAVGHGPYKDALSDFLTSLENRGAINLQGVSPRFVSEQYIGMLYSFLLYSRVMDKSVNISLDQAKQIVRECSILFVSRFNTEENTK